jgi:outer membrane translocation and assembly module TamA
VPFWALSSLGGDRSVLGDRQPLRGFGSDRFIDRNSFSSSVELRSKIFDINLFTTDLTFEMAPFVDAGRVFHNLDDNPLDRLHVAGGIGLRAIAEPFIVGYVDIGYGSEGTAIFSGVDYPF